MTDDGHMLFGSLKATALCTIFIGLNETDSRKGQNRGVWGVGVLSKLKIQSWTICSRRDAQNARKVKIQHVENSTCENSACEFSQPNTYDVVIVFTNVYNHSCAVGNKYAL